jgi:putative phosphoesterase
MPHASRIPRDAPGILLFWNGTFLMLEGGSSISIERTDTMKIAIISDTHSRHELVEQAVQQIDGHRPELVLHCGDIDDAETVWLFQPNTHFVWGNCDYDKTAMRQAMHGIGATLHEYLGVLELGGKKIGFLHGDDPELLGDLEHSGEYDFVFHGHTHVRGERRCGKTRIINPGAIHRVKQRTFAILDVESGALDFVVVE